MVSAVERRLGHFEYGALSASSFRTVVGSLSELMRSKSVVEGEPVVVLLAMKKAARSLSQYAGYPRDLRRRFDNCAEFLPAVFMDKAAPIPPPRGQARYTHVYWV